MYVVVGRLLLSFTFFYVHFLPVMKLKKKSTFRICRNLFRVIGVTDQEWLDSSTSLLVVVGCSKWLPKSVFGSKRYRITYYNHHKGLIRLNKATSGFGKAIVKVLLPRKKVSKTTRNCLHNSQFGSAEIYLKQFV